MVVVVGQADTEIVRVACLLACLLVCLLLFG